MNQKPAFPYATHLDIKFPATASRYAWGEVVGVTSHVRFARGARGLTRHP